MISLAYLVNKNNALFFFLEKKNSTFFDGSVELQYKKNYCFHQKGFLFLHKF